MKSFKKHFDIIYNKIKNNENFAFIRFSDGEMFVMQNRKLELSERGTYIDDQLAGPTYTKEDYKFFDPAQHQDFKNKLIQSYQHKQDAYYVGLSCACCVGMQSYKWMKSLRGSDDEHLTWSNLFVNSNYPLFIQNILPELLNKKIVIICNENADLSNSKFNIVKDFRIGRNAMINNADIYKDISKWIEDNDIKDHVFCFSASSLTNITVYELYQKYANNTYIDIGTTLNPVFGFPLTRDYLKAYWSNQDHPDLHKTCIWL
jgi:hypothetical protein